MGRLRDSWARLRDRLTGTKYPESGVTPLPVTEVRAALLALNGTGVPFQVRHAFGVERADLVAEWRVVLPAMGDSPRGERVQQTMKARMRLVPAEREVHVLDEVSQVALAGNPRRRGLSREWGRGSHVARQWTYERGPDGRWHKVVLFDSRDIRDPLRDAVLGAGWTWRGVFRL